MKNLLIFKQLEGKLNIKLSRDLLQATLSDSLILIMDELLIKLMIYI